MGTPLRVDRDPHLVELRDVTVKRTNRDAERRCQLAGLLVRPALQEHDEGDQSAARLAMLAFHDRDVDFELTCRIRGVEGRSIQLELRRRPVW